MAVPTGKYIVYVEDDPDDIAFFKDYFGHLDHLTVTIFNNGKELINFLDTLTADQYPCIIVLDINMPIMGGWETVKELQKEDRYTSIPVVLFSTSSLEREKESSSKYGVDVVTKPFSIQEADGIAEKLLSYCGSKTR
jgi:CheY-like chemotaxis protein